MCSSDLSANRLRSAVDRRPPPTPSVGAHQPVDVDLAGRTVEHHEPVAQGDHPCDPVEEAELVSDVLWGLGVVAVEERTTSDANVVELWTSLGDEPVDHLVQRRERTARAVPLRSVPYRPRRDVDLRLPESASKQYEEVLKSQEKTRGDADASLMAPLRQMVKLDLLVTQATKAEHRDRLAALVSEHADADPIERGLSFAVLGDWAIVANDGTGARDYYKQAWTSITQNPQFDVAGYFSAPSMIDFVAPLSSVDQNLRSRPYAWGQIQFNFNVAPDGLPANVTIVGLGDDQEPTLIQSQYNRRLRETHFRPRLVAGEPVLTANVKSTHYYRYYLEKEKKEKKSRNKAKGRDEEEPAAEKSKG